MRCHYMSDLHLETQEFPWRLPRGDVLILAGDISHACCLDPARSTPYAVRQRDRVLRLFDDARANFAHVLLVAGNHDHYDGISRTRFRRCENTFRASPFSTTRMSTSTGCVSSGRRCGPTSRDAAELP